MKENENLKTETSELLSSSFYLLFYFMGKAGLNLGILFLG